MSHAADPLIVLQPPDAAIVASSKLSRSVDPGAMAYGSSSVVAVLDRKVRPSRVKAVGSVLS